MDNDLLKLTPKMLGLLWPSQDNERTLRQRELADVLRFQLEQPVTALYAANARSLADADTVSICDVLQGPATAKIQSLRVLKEWAKDSAQSPDATVPRQIAKVLYFAAVAAALVRCGQRISDLDDASLRDGLEWSLRQPFVKEVGLSILRDGLRVLG